MDVKTTSKPETSEVELLVTVPTNDFKPYVERAAQLLTKDKPLKGFRPGRAPLDLVIETFGKERVLQEALNKAMPHFYVQAVLDENLDALGQPALTVKELSLEQGLTFTATTAVLPEVTLGDLSHLTVNKRPVSVTSEEIEAELHYLAKMRSTPLDVARPAQVGDTVTVDFKVSMNGQTMEGGESKNHPVHLGDGHFVPDFEKKLEGIQVNDEREFNITFPSDYTREELRDKQAQVWVKAHAVQKRIIPELNDDFAKKLGKFTNLQEVRAQLTQNLQQEKEHKEQDRFRGELTEGLASQASFGPIPDMLIEREIDHRLQEFSQMLAYQQKTVDDYLKQHHKSLPDIRQDMRESAIRAVKVGLALRAFAEQEEITVTETEVAEKVNEYLRRFASTHEAEEQVNQDDLKESLASTLRNQKVLQALESRVQVTHEAVAEKTVTAKD